MEVDDLLMSGDSEEMSSLRDKLPKRFTFGKWKRLQDQDVEFAGRRFRKRHDRMLIDQENTFWNNFILLLCLEAGSQVHANNGQNLRLSTTVA